MEVCPRFVEPNENRPMPEIDSIADEPSPSKRRPRERSGHEAFILDGADDEREGGELGEPEAAAIEKGLASVEPGPGEREPRRREHADDIDERRGQARWAALFAERRHPGCKRGADEDRRAPRVGPEVRPRRRTGLEEMEHQRRADHGERDRDDPQRPRALLGKAEKRGDEQRPGGVELLLDREAPGVLERRRLSEEVPVASVREDRPPVGDVPERRQTHPSECGRSVGRGEANQRA